MKNKVFIAGLFTLAVSACGQQGSSHLDGHFENSSSQEANKFSGSQIIPPEYAPVDSVIVSEALITNYGREDLIQAILDAGAQSVLMAVPRNSSTSTSTLTYSNLRQMIGKRIAQVKLLPQTASGTLTVWARDWSPLSAISKDGKIRLLDLNYYPERPADDSMARTLEKTMGYSRVSVPVYNEGGNFMDNGRQECLMTTRVTDANATQAIAGDLILDAEQVSAYYKDFGGCSKVSIFPRMPNEKTGHIDMWGKFLDDDTVIVNQVSVETISYAKSASARSFALKIQAFMDERAAEIENLGYRVVRIPMPLPQLGLFRSYTNSLLVNGTAILTDYVQRGYADDALMGHYKAAAKKAYEDLGYKTSWIPSDELIATGGAIHCVTMQIPKSNPTPN